MSIVTSSPQRIFCDSFDAWLELVNQGAIDSNTPVLTRSIFINEKPNIPSIYIDGRISREERIRFKCGIQQNEREIASKLSSYKEFLPYVTLFLQQFNNFQADILDAAMLNEDVEFRGRNVIVVPVTGKAELDQVIRPKWADWFASDPAWSIVETKVQFHNERSPRGDGRAAFIDRLRLGGKSALLWRLSKIISLPNFLFKMGSVGLVGQSELSRDALVAFLFSGIKPVHLKLPALHQIKHVQSASAEKMLSCCNPLIESRLSIVRSPKMKRILNDVLLRRVSDEIAKYDNFKVAWNDILSAEHDITHIVAGYQKGAMAAALSHVCKDKKIKLMACQHGVTRELLNDPSERQIFFETNYCDHFFAMNAQAARISKNYVANGRTVDVSIAGVPSEMRNVKSERRPTKEVLFVSTNLYAGHSPNGVPPCSDRELAEAEMQLIDRVFDGLKKHVDYKPYPSIRLIDPDSVLARIRDCDNINIVGTHCDMRYLAGKYRLIITTKATSTVSWALMSQRPVVFIDHFCHARLSPLARKALSNGIFVFDQADTDFHRALHEFLSRSFEEIEAEWIEKSDARQKLYSGFLGPQDYEAGKHISDTISQDLMSGQG